MARSPTHGQNQTTGNMHVHTPDLLTEPCPEPVFPNCFNGAIIIVLGCAHVGQLVLLQEIDTVLLED